MNSHSRFSSSPLRRSRLLGRFGMFVLSTALLPAQLPEVLDPSLAVRPVISGLNQPTGLAFIRDNDFFVLEKATGRVQRIFNGQLYSTELDLAVNSASERGLLGIALHPGFMRTNGSVYLYWTESSTGADSNQLADVSLLANRVDHFSWDGFRLNFVQNIIRIRAYQADPGQPLRGNHNGGVIRFGPDGKLYIYIGDGGRRGQMQNLPDGPGPAGNQPDDQFGGPEPDDAHLTGVILRLNDDGSIPTDNPFYAAGANRGGEAGRNLQKVFAYGIRNGFGMEFDPYSGALWEAQNGDDSFTEVNLVDPGSNLGWIQTMGPVTRQAQFRSIETTAPFVGLQQNRWPATNISPTADQAFARMFMVYDGGNRAGAILSGGEESPPVATPALAAVQIELGSDGRLTFDLWSVTAIENVTAAHLHLGGATQNGPIVLPLFSSPTGQSFGPQQLIARGTVDDSAVLGAPNFAPNLSALVERTRQGRVYANVHTTDNPGGKVRGQLTIIDRNPVSRYVDPRFSWKYEIAPAAVGFVAGDGLGASYEGNMIVAGATATLQGGHLFRFPLSSDRRAVQLSDARLQDGVADNTAKYDITESESLLFGRNFGVGTHIQTGPDGALYVVSLGRGAVYRIGRQAP